MLHYTSPLFRVVVNENCLCDPSRNLDRRSLVHHARQTPLIITYPITGQDHGLDVGASFRSVRLRPSLVQTVDRLYSTVQLKFHDRHLPCQFDRVDICKLQRFPRSDFGNDWRRRSSGCCRHSPRENVTIALLYCERVSLLTSRTKPVGLTRRWTAFISC